MKTKLTEAQRRYAYERGVQDERKRVLDILERDRHNTEELAKLHRKVARSSKAGSLARVENTSVARDYESRAEGLREVAELIRG